MEQPELKHSQKMKYLQTRNIGPPKQLNFRDYVGFHQFHSLPQNSGEKAQETETVSDKQSYPTGFPEETLSDRISYPKPFRKENPVRISR